MAIESEEAGGDPRAPEMQRTDVDDMILESSSTLKVCEDLRRGDGFQSG